MLIFLLVKAQFPEAGTLIQIVLFVFSVRFDSGKGSKYNVSLFIGQSDYIVFLFTVGSR